MSPLTAFGLGFAAGIIVLLVATLLSAARDYNDDHGEHHPN